MYSTQKSKIVSMLHIRGDSFFPENYLESFNVELVLIGSVVDTSKMGFSTGNAELA